MLPTKLTVILWQNSLLLWLHLPVSPVRILNPYFEAVACLAQRAGWNLGDILTENQL